MDLLVSLIVVLIVVGLALYLVQEFLPIDARIKMVICAVIVLVAIVWLIQASGIMAGIDT